MSQTKAQLISDLVQALNFTGTASAPANGLFLSASNQLKLATASTERLKIDGTELVVNDTGASVDFRVEGDASTHLLFADASTDRIGIGTSSPGSLLSLVGATDAVTGISLGATTTISTSRYIGICQAANETNIAVNSGFQGIEFGGPSSAKEGYLAFHTHDVGVSSGERVRITKGGQVGIGTNDPGSLLSISGANDSVTGISLGPASTSITHSRYIGLTDTNNNANLGANSGFQGIEFGGPGSANEGYLAFHTHDAGVQSSECLRMDKSGNIGIGTTSPSQRLHVSGSAPEILLEHTGGNDMTLTTSDGMGMNGITVNGGFLSLAYNNKNIVMCRTGGSVGIGTTSPDQKLHISNAATFAGLKVSSTNNNTRAMAELNGKDSSGNEVELRIGGFGDTNRGEIFTVTNHAIGFATNNSAPQMVLDTAGELGIGTTSPSTLLHVKSADNILATFESTDADALIEFKDNGTSDTILMGALGGDDLVLRCDPGNITFRLDNNSEKARFDSNGNLGIGTSNPGAKLQIATAAVDTDVFRIMRQDNTGLPLFRIFQDSSSGGGAGGCHLNTNNRHLMITAKSSSSVTDSSGLYLKTSGELGIGTSSPSSSYQTTIQEGDTGNGCLLLDRTSNIDGTHRSMVSFERSGTQVGTILCSNSSTQFNTSSDHRLKENVVTMSNATDRLKQLQPKRFNFILNPDITVDGFLAHEVQSVVPEAISGTKDEVDSDNNPIYQGIDQSKLVPLLVAAVKELTARVETLEAA